MEQPEATTVSDEERVRHRLRARAARRQTIESADNLSTTEKLLLLHIHEHGDDMQETMEDGFKGLERRAADQARAAGRLLYAQFAFYGLVIVFLISGVFMLRGIDPMVAAEATKTVTSK